MSPDDLIVAPDVVISPRFEFFRSRSQTSSRNLLFFFHHFQAEKSGALYGGAAPWLKAGFDMVQVACPEGDSYRTLPPDEIRAALAFATAGGYAARFGTGMSMGAFGAILLSEELGLDRVLALAPRLVLVSEKGSWVKTADAGDFQALDQNPGRALSRASQTTRFFVIFDPAQPQDAETLGHFAGCIPKQNLSVLPIRHAGHDVRTALIEAGVFPKAVISALEHGDLSGLDRKVVRNASKSALLGLAGTLALRGRLDCAARINDGEACKGPVTAPKQLADRVTVLLALGAQDALRDLLLACPDSVAKRLFADRRGDVLLEPCIQLLEDDQALEKLLLWTGTQPLGAWLPLRLSQLARGLGKMQTALALLDGRFLENRRPDFHSAVVLAELRIDLGHWQAAVDGLDQRIMEDGCTTHVWRAVQIFRKAHAHFRDTGNAPAALRAISLAIRSKDDGWQNYQRAILHAAAGRQDEARKDLSVGARLLPEDQAYHKAAQALIARLAAPGAC